MLASNRPAAHAATRARRRVLGLAAPLLVLAGVLAACSGGDDPAAAPASSAASVAATTCPAPAAPPANAERQTVTSPQGERSYHLWTPTGYDGTRPVPLVVDYHGTGGESLRYSTTFSGMVRDDLDRGYLVVAPQAVNGVWGAPGYTGAGDDVAFTKQLIDTVRAKYCVDPTRVYATGFSLGGGFSAYISCVYDVWAAVAPAGGVNFARPCPTAAPMPAIVWHGRTDAIAPFGSQTATAESPVVPGENYVGEVPLDIDGWAVRNGCTPGRLDTVLNPDVTKRTYAGCKADIVLYDHSGGHTLPGSLTMGPDQSFRGAQTMAINAPTVTLDFFDAHRRTTPPAAAPSPTDAAGMPVG